MTAGIVRVPSSNGSVSSKGSTSTTSTTANKSKKSKSLYKKLFKKKKNKNGVVSDGASLASIQEENFHSNNSKGVGSAYPPSTVTTKFPPLPPPGVGASNTLNGSNNHSQTNNSINNEERAIKSQSNGVVISKGTTKSSISTNAPPSQVPPQSQQYQHEHQFDDITQAPFGSFQHGGIITRLHESSSTIPTKTTIPITTTTTGTTSSTSTKPTNTSITQASLSLAVDTSVQVRNSKNTSTATSNSNADADADAIVPSITKPQPLSSKTLPQTSIDTIQISNNTYSADDVSELPTPSPFRGNGNGTGNGGTPTIRNTSSNISALTEDPTGFYDSSTVVSSSQASTANRSSSLASFFGGTFSFASTTGSNAGADSIPVTPSPVHNKKKPKFKMNILPPIADVAGGTTNSGSSSTSSPSNYHMLQRTKLDVSSSPSLSSSISASPVVVEQSKESTLLKQESIKDAILLSEKYKNGNFITRSNGFKKLVKWSFMQIDSDQTGHVDQQELYTGLLLIHLELAKYVGAAACRPMSREQVYELFNKLDVDQSGTLSKDEFTSVITIMCSQLVTRVITLFTSTILLVPLLTRIIVDGTKHVWTLDDIVNKRKKVINICSNVVWPNIKHYLTMVYNKIDYGYNITSTKTNEILIQYSNTTTIPNNLSSVKELCIEQSYKIWNTTQTHVPHTMIVYYYKMLTLYDEYIYANIPDNLEETLPYAITSCILASLLVPYFLAKIDNFYSWLTDRKKKHTTSTK